MACPVAMQALGASMRNSTQSARGRSWGVSLAAQPGTERMEVHGMGTSSPLQPSHGCGLSFQSENMAEEEDGWMEGWIHRKKATEQEHRLQMISGAPVGRSQDRAGCQ